jgi:hypothetical protein
MTFDPAGPSEVKRITAPFPPPPTIETRFAGQLSFAGGFPTEQTVQALYDQLDFQRACQVFLRHIMGAAIYGFAKAWQRDLKVAPSDLAIFHLDASGLLLTGNSETVYGVGVLDLKPDGPLVFDVPPKVLGLVNDLWMRPLGDVGLVGPDRGEGGRYLLVPPGFEGEIAEEEFLQVVRPRTYRVWLVFRGFMGPGGDPAPPTALLRQTRIYPLAAAADPPANNHRECSGVPFDTIHPTDIRYFEDLAEIIEYEPVDAVDPEVGAMLAQIGIEKGKPFAPDERMTAILTEAAQVGSYMAFCIANAPRDEYKKYDDRQWYATVAGYPEFRDEHNRPLVDLMVRMAWFGTGRTRAMQGERVGVGSAYTWTYRDQNGEWIDPAKTYKIHLPGPIPAKDFWSVVVYDLWTRSMLANGQPFPSLNSYSPGIEIDEDGGVTVYIGPEPPDGKEANWVRTLPDTGWFPMLRLYGPLEPWIDQTWKPDDPELIS